MLFEGFKSLFGGGGQLVTGSVTGRGFPKVLVIGDFWTSAQAVTASKWNTIGEYTVPAQQKYRIGYGDANHPDNQGYIYILLKNAAGTELTGKIRLTYSDANKFAKDTVFEQQEAVLHGSTTDRRIMVALPETPVKAIPGRTDGMVRQDDRILIEFYPDSSDTVSTTTPVIYIPVTQY
jgi:hypothetical protein